MRHTFLLIPILWFCSINVQGQSSEEDYCIPLRLPSAKQYYKGQLFDSIIAKQNFSGYAEELARRSEMLWQFGEEPLGDSTCNVFRAVTFGAFNNPKDVRIIRIDKKGAQVQVTFKVVNSLGDRTVQVHKKNCNSGVWDEFVALANSYFINQPSIKSSHAAVHDGSTTVFEGCLFDRYHYLERHVMGQSDPELYKIYQFLFKSAGTIFGEDCEANLREK